MTYDNANEFFGEDEKIILTTFLYPLISINLFNKSAIAEADLK
ncbi:11350_t:CDS:2 [Diversispora eburnea]|uniref:11350_t:CDS:1 n=1 Tax=Diversispora eburnea TaxID=1213867 RepID=A0A9N8ZPB5_9GLOM|nr:11350_t:CDS:2 [Diversispora eburnea]